MPEGTPAAALGAVPPGSAAAAGQLPPAWVPLPAGAAGQQPAGRASKPGKVVGEYSMVVHCASIRQLARLESLQVRLAFSGVAWC